MHKELFHLTKLTTLTHLGEREQYVFLLNLSVVHTDDVARVHIFLFENPEVKGRYICSSHTMTIEDLSKFLSAKYPEFPIPTITVIYKHS